MNLYVKALAVPVLALGLACSTSGSSKKTASSRQGAGMSGQATAGVGSQDSTHQTMNEGTSGSAGMSGSAGASGTTTGSSPGAVASDLKGHASDKLVSGRVADVSSDRLSITSDQGGREDLQLVDQTVVTIDGRDAHASDLKQGQDVRASYNDVDGQRVAVKVEAAASGSGSGSTSGGSWGTGTGSTTDRTPPSEATPGSTGSSRDDSGRGGTTGSSGLSNPNTGAPPGTPPSGKTGQTTKDPSKNY